MNELALKYESTENNHKNYIKNNLLFSNQFMFLFNTFSSEIVLHEGFNQFIKDEIKLLNRSSLLHLVHPDDREEVNNILNKMHCYWFKKSCNSIFSILFRMKKENNLYTQVHLQSKVKERFDRGLISINVVSDINYFYTLNKVTWSINGKSPKESHGILNYEKKTTQSFTEREIDILELIHKGFKCQKIADQLGISLYTVYTHRRNMLNRNKLENIWQLVNLALQEGII